MKDAKNAIVFSDLTKHEWSEYLDALSQGKTLLMSFENGEKMKNSIEKGYIDALQANLEIVEEGSNLGVCGCGKTANTKALVWRD
ncbi:hypothetical protein SCHIN_v1c01570 [Spiroplasma chinense]|uniref:Uncharacterized protein n=1 Tax=Spiroplasma chinense TaxID=216932 RepID=A0A5B9Y3I6_9MOLU|nr:hypothetical protein [Spiroplasma chinense]QEH61355.1 hypothetical protein SCHIN_v1c01570 [Spiroplasma chinense]